MEPLDTVIHEAGSLHVQLVLAARAGAAQARCSATLPRLSFAAEVSLRGGDLAVGFGALWRRGKGLVDLLRGGGSRATPGSPESPGRLALERAATLQLPEDLPQPVPDLPEEREAAAALLRRICRDLPLLEEAFQHSEHGLEAARRAREVVELARRALSAGEPASLRRHHLALKRVERMCQGARSCRLQAA